MTPDGRKDPIAARYAVAIRFWDVAEGRDRNGMTPYERTRFEAWRKGGCSIEGAIHLMLENQRG